MKQIFQIFKLLFLVCLFFVMEQSVFGQGNGNIIKYTSNPEVGVWMNNNCVGGSPQNSFCGSSHVNDLLKSRIASISNNGQFLNYEIEKCDGTNLSANGKAQVTWDTDYSCNNYSFGTSYTAGTRTITVQVENSFFANGDEASYFLGIESSGALKVRAGAIQISREFVRGPDLISPLDNATNTSLTPTISWYSANGRGIDYKVVIQRGTTTIEQSNWLSGTSYSVSSGSLEENTTYTVSIFARFGISAGNYEYSPISSRTFTTEASCDIPTGTTENSITTSSANLDWNTISSSNFYNVRHREQGTNSWTVDSPTSSNFSLTGLAANTTYEWQVRSHCGADESSYSSIRTFTTPIACNTPIGLEEVSITTISVILNWDSMTGSNNYTVQWREMGGVWQTLTENSSFYRLEGLRPNTSYQWQVRSDCGSNNSDYSPTRTFTTETPTCDIPIGTGENNLAYYDVDLDWGDTSGANDYLLRWREQGGVWTTVTTNDSRKQLTNLVQNTTYEWQVRANCSFGNSNYSTLRTFTTQEVITTGTLDVLIDPIGAISAGAQWRILGESIWRDSGTSITLNAGNHVIEYKDIVGWVKPTNQDITIAANNGMITTGTYVESVALTGTLDVSIETLNAINAGAQWRIVGESTWRNSGVSITLDAGDYVIEYKDIVGWIKPSNQNVTITANTINTQRGVYTQNQTPVHDVRIYSDTLNSVIGAITTSTTKIKSLDLVGSIFFVQKFPVDIEVVAVREILTNTAFNIINNPDGTTEVVVVWFTNSTSLTFDNEPIIEFDLRINAGNNGECFDHLVDEVFASDDAFNPINNAVGDIGKLCVPNEFVVNGNIVTEDGLTVNNVRVYNQNDLLYTTAQDGLFETTQLYGTNLELRFEKDRFAPYNSYLQSNDLQKIQAFILRAVSFTAAEQIIADVSSDGRVMPNDLHTLQDLIIRRLTDFPESPTWKFATDLDLSSNPFNPVYSTAISIPSLAADEDVSGRVLALATGDVAPLRRSVMRTEDESILVEQRKEVLENGNVKYSFISQSNAEILSFQFEGKSTNAPSKVELFINDNRAYNFSDNILTIAPVNYSANPIKIYKDDVLFEVTLPANSDLEIDNSALSFKTVTPNFDLAEVRMIEIDNEEIFRLFPNPASSNVNIYAKEKATMTIYDMQGRKVHNSELQQGLNTLSLNLSKGLYVVNIGKTNQKLVIE